MRRLVFVIFAATALPAAADDLDIAWAEAQALVRAELWKDALGSLDRALAAKPDFGPALLMRAQVRARLELPADLDAAIARGDERDWTPVEAVLAALKKDLAAFLGVTPASAPERAAGVAELEQRTDQLNRVQQLAAGIRAKAEAAREADRQAAIRKKLADDKAAQDLIDRQNAEAWQQRRLVAEALRNEDVEAAGVRRRWGIVLAAAGAAAGGGSAALFVSGNAKYDQVKAGGFKTGKDIGNKLTAAGTEHTGALALAIGGGGLLVTGVLLLVSSKEPPPVQVSALVSPTAVGVGVSGSIP